MQINGRLGKAEMGLDFEVVRELSESDVLLREITSVGSVAPGIKSLRALHHKLAQGLAMGQSDTEASIMTGYSPSRISILKSDPTFRELLSFYSQERAKVFVDVQQRMAGFATTAVEVLQERLEDKPESFSNKDLNSLIKTTADRGGHSPVARSENKTIILDARDLATIKKEVEQKQNGQVRKINQADESRRVKDYLEGKGGQELSGDSGAKLSSNDNSTGTVLEQTKTEGKPGEGTDI